VGRGGAAPPGARGKKYGAPSFLFILEMFLTKHHCVELYLHLKLTGYQIQNDFIAALAKRVTTVIVDEVKAAKFDFVIIDSPMH